MAYVSVKLIFQVTPSYLKKEKAHAFAKKKNKPKTEKQKSPPPPQKKKFHSEVI